MEQRNRFIRSLLGGGLLLTVLTVDSCTAPRHVSQVVRESRVDTVYLNNISYDSIYILKDRTSEQRKDTVYVREVQVEYRYRMLRDTAVITRTDSIPYEVTVVETKEIVRPVTWYDKLTRGVFWIVVGTLLAALGIRTGRVIKYRRL